MCSSDLLADFVSFGVVPSLLLYLWAMQEAGRFGWILVLLYTVCCVLRLARFNTFLEDPDKPAWTANFFTGVPAPMGAALVLLPMLLSFQFDTDFFRNPALVSVVLVAVSAPLISRIPPYLLNKHQVSNRGVLPRMPGAGTHAILLTPAPWM